MKRIQPKYKGLKNALHLFNIQFFVSLTLSKIGCDQLFLSQVHENGKRRSNYHNKENRRPYAKRAAFKLLFCPYLN